MEPRSESQVPRRLLIGPPSSPGPIDVGHVEVNHLASTILQISNSGNYSLHITSLSLSGANAGDFTQTNTCGSSLAGGASCTINVAFAPTTAAAASGTIAVSYPGMLTPVSVAVTGTGIAPVTITPASLAFSTTQRVGIASAAQAVTIRNRATTPLIIQSIVASPADYTQTNNCGASLAGNATCNVNVIFNPQDQIQVQIYFGGLNATI